MNLPFKIPERVIDALIARAAANPYFDLADYMTRGWVFRLGPRRYLERYNTTGAGWVSARVHHILRDDDDRAFHDHPQDYISIILRGGYSELTPLYAHLRNFRRRIDGEQATWYPPGSVLYRKAESPHRLVLPPGVKEAVTLFITGPRRREWGFHFNKSVASLTLTGTEHGDLELPLEEETWVPWQDFEQMIVDGKFGHSWRKPYGGTRMKA